MSYAKAKAFLIGKPDLLVSLERFFVEYLKALFEKHWSSFARDYDEASFLYPFWQNYPPDERGRQPRGDQFPWIEVGEHSIGAKLPRILDADFKVRDTGIPTGADQRFVLASEKIAAATDGFTDSAWLSVDIKSVGPRDESPNSPHAVMSHNQVSGDGVWKNLEEGVKNTVIQVLESEVLIPFIAGFRRCTSCQI